MKENIKNTLVILVMLGLFVGFVFGVVHALDSDTNKKIDKRLQEHGLIEHVGTIK